MKVCLSLIYDKRTLANRNPRTMEETHASDERKYSCPLPKARYLIKLAEEQQSNAAVTSYVVRLLQEQGMECVVEKGHIVVSADDTKLKSQARYLRLLTSHNQVVFGVVLFVNTEEHRQPVKYAIYNV